MKRHFLIGFTILVATFSWCGFVAGDPSKNHPVPVSKTVNKDSLFHTSLFLPEEVEQLQAFFINNASLPEQPKDSNWQPGYRHKCINTVRAALDILLFGSSSIPDSMYSRHPVLNGNFINNDIYALVHRLKDSNYIRSYDSIRFLSMRKGEWETIAKNDPISRGLPPVILEKSLWNTLIGRAGNQRGISVFLISLCDGYHAAMLTLDHRNPAQLKVYWADQTHRHPVRFFVNDKLQEEPNHYGWEVMQATGIDTVKTGQVRGLDAYVTYANKKYWCDCGSVKHKPEDCCAGNCYPYVQIWRVQKSRMALPANQ